ncbi:MAG: CYTH domain-containing protein [Chitinophagales bacterium]|nr:CYTH domain-containing protein [Chitinophagales bacterium]
MGVEIERKFLLKNKEWRVRAGKGIEIRQGYLNSTKERTVRIRINGGIGLITVKGETINSTRKEYEYQIPIEDAEELLELCEKPIVEKTRFEIVHNQKVWEIDEFKGVNKGLIVAEVELEDENEELEFPLWIGEEVTSDPRYYNANLIAHPYLDWDC